ncbi:AraC-like DNA-binding protein/mannose-6-phosphate isomerase-like protein (cupin superfamily) [Clostridium acetobutylicum]|uniref:AraC-type DNA-binding domain-containing protein n=1 Tax=Clostridium acetobutylicum (strain ATCC 824 / DSM 792 / JCM 1419 / IAM 19013 / LMG 5710 / NBRC 13948 / NRRL B-527 / VKM B-1787 / 2291 / W) TaxID=272562 RepID=Q97J35_CLOAB|nr:MULTISPECIES: AraC family transcriptional regulator [Clostridium]AAK79419.1 AraC-type DNA-binding domain-containing protein [Clostridium acetobutylicum ATCC 824]ADZ20504.1 AraC-type DNA-binding domain-containing protein [Clostridium acetobutylicum EA 2018]AEI33612.1 AraC-type DNA-binding domain-containing protein [Clostridium acetobutylicum DSM 1731]AWV81333.1 AraC family transcriptional regulator [Clostridium acetobutylicum]MBC2392968.1 AraC family transcriptional regulator [Clostridium ac
MNDKSTYFDRKSKKEDCFVDIFFKDDILNGENFKRHWHEHLQIYYFTAGTAYLECAQNKFDVTTGSIAIINSNELHYLESHSNNLKFYTIRIEPTFLFSNKEDLLQTKYLAPLALNRITFKNLIENDLQILECIKTILKEYSSKNIGYELAVKANIYQLIVYLLRGYVDKILNENEFEERKRILNKFQCVFRLIEEKYTEKLTLNELADCVNFSTHHFCRTFKQMTGKTTTDYINGIRLYKSTNYLKQTDLNITEIAIKCGFDNNNYFSRLFKKHYDMTPTKYRKLYAGHFSKII